MGIEESPFLRCTAPRLGVLFCTLAVAVALAGDDLAIGTIANRFHRLLSTVLDRFLGMRAPL